MSAGKGSRPRPVDPSKYAEGYEKAFGKKPDLEEIIRKAKERHPVDAHRRKTFTGLGGEVCPGFHAKEFLHGTPDDDPADLDA